MVHLPVRRWVHRAFASLGLLCALLLVLTDAAGASTFKAAIVSSNGSFSAGTLQLEGTTAGSVNCYSTGSGSGGSVTVSNTQPCTSGSPMPTGELSSTASSSATTTLTSAGRVNATSSTTASSVCGVAQLADSESATDWGGTGPDNALPFYGVTYQAAGPLGGQAITTDGSTGWAETTTQQSREFHRADVAQDNHRVGRHPRVLQLAGPRCDRPQRRRPAVVGGLDWQARLGHLQRCDRGDHELFGREHRELGFRRRFSGSRRHRPLCQRQQSCRQRRLHHCLELLGVVEHRLGLLQQLARLSHRQLLQRFAGSARDHPVSAHHCPGVDDLRGEHPVRLRDRDQHPQPCQLLAAQRHRLCPLRGKRPGNREPGRLLRSRQHRHGTGRGDPRGERAHDVGHFFGHLPQRLVGVGGDDQLVCRPGVGGLSVVAWFKTTTTSGGTIIGFDNLQNNSNPGQSDRLLWMDNTGHLVWALYNGGNDEITTPAAYNTGAWVMVVAEVGSSGAELYVNGTEVANNVSYTAGQNYTGYWHIGWGYEAGGWSDAPTSGYLNGSESEVAVVPSQLTSAKITTLYGETSTSAFSTYMISLTPDLVLAPSGHRHERLRDHRDHCARHSGIDQHLHLPGRGGRDRLPGSELHLLVDRSRDALQLGRDHVWVPRHCHDQDGALGSVGVSRQGTSPAVGLGVRHAVLHVAVVGWYLLPVRVSRAVTGG